MRLTQNEIDRIRSTASRIYGEDVRVYLFGSRTDDSARGGDIDLLIDSPSAERMTFDNKITFLVEVKKAIGDRKIDVLYNKAELQDEPVIVHAKRTGIPLQ